ncbi:MAG: hypothetical protein IIA50_00865 [Bacteroidetes bacterium]|nr:hypothetical protein [Bacteroidota bacterium]
MEGSAVILAVIGTILILGGPIAGYFVFRYKYGQRIKLADARERKLKARALKINKARRSSTGSPFSDSASESEDTVSLLKEEVEQKSLELSIVRQDYELEFRVLNEENNALRTEISSLKGEPVEVQDVVRKDRTAAFRTSPSKAEPEETEEVSDIFEYLYPEASETIIPESEDISSQEKPEPLQPDSTETTDREEPEVESASVRPDRPPKSFEPKTPEESAEPTVPLPAFKPVFDLIGAQAEVPPDTSEIRRIVQLPDEQFRLLSDLGYATLDKIACLSSSEVRRLTEILKLQTTVIESAWIPNAQLKLFDGKK